MDRLAADLAVCARDLVRLVRPSVSERLRKNPRRAAAARRVYQQRRWLERRYASFERMVHRPLKESVGRCVDEVPELKPLHDDLVQRFEKGLQRAVATYRAQVAKLAAR
jgi:hypothetical protein